MGCDYYTWIETIIVYKDLSGVLCRFVDRGESQRCYEELDDIDTDFKPLPTTGQILNEEIRVYGKKMLFTAGIWVCHYNGKMRIQEICEKNGIPLGSLVDVYKQMGGRVA